MVLRKIAALLLITLFFLRNGNALTIDSFSEEAIVSSTSTVGASRRIYVPSPSALGGGRSLIATKSGGGNGSTVLSVGEGSLSHSQGFHGGSSTIIWDGDSDPNTVNPTGLGSIDLTQDGGTALRIRFNFFNFPLNTPIEIAVRLYDSGTTDGSRYSEVALQLAQSWTDDGVSPLSVEIPFQTFRASGQTTLVPLQGGTLTATTSVGPNGPSRVNAVGAISMFIRGESNNRGPYVTLLPFTTNGRCSSVPTVEGRVVDDCGVCMESPHANSGRDRCGVCLFGTTGYSYPAQKVNDDCGLCPWESNYSMPSGNRDACGVCFNGPPPYTYRSIEDVCGVCGGFETSISRCRADTQDCSPAQPTAQILGFERRIVAQANKLLARYSSAQRIFARANCSGLLFGSSREVVNAHQSIVSKAQRTFRSNIAICNQDCATISYSAGTVGLTSYFRLIELHTLSAARKVDRCYQRLGKPPPLQGSARETSKAIVASRNARKAVIEASSRARVCKAGSDSGS